MRSKAGRARAAVPRSAILSAEAHCTGVNWPDSIKALKSKNAMQYAQTYFVSAYAVQAKYTPYYPHRS